MVRHRESPAPWRRIETLRCYWTVRLNGPKTPFAPPTRRSRRSQSFEKLLDTDLPAD
jgi:hypothetical protein